jgi:F-type H+-transporting ATPase subunit epsilon
MSTNSGPLTVRVLTPVGAVYDGGATMVVAPGEAGPVGLLPRHEPMVCTLAYGRTRVVGAEGGEASFATSTGFVTIDGREVLVLVEQAIPVDEIDLARAQADLRAAEEALEAAGEDETALANAAAEKLRAENLIKVAEESK